MSTGNSGSGFTDPLENYEPKTYDDSLEQAICESSASQIQHTPFTTISPEDSVATALQRLASDHIACLMVVEDNRLVGIFTNREVLNKVALEDEILDRPVREVMTADPVFVRDDDPVAATLCVMAVHGYRHVPILTVDNEVSGIVSPQRITNFLSKAVADGS